MAGNNRRDRKITARDIEEEPSNIPPARSNPLAGSGPDAALWAMGGQSPVGMANVSTDLPGYVPGTTVTGGGGAGNMGGLWPVVGDVPYAGNRYEGDAALYSPTGANFLYGEVGTDILAQDVLASLGFNNPNAGVLPEFTRQMANAFPLAMLASGGGMPTEEALINYAFNFGKESLQQGGQGIDSAAMLEALFAGINDPSSPIYNYLFGPGMTPEEQDYAFRYMLAAATGGLAPMAQRAVMNAAENANVQWQRQMAHGDMAAGGTPYADYLRTNSVVPGFVRGG